MKILIISDAWHPQVNGVVRTYEHLSEELEKKGHDVKVIGPQDFRFTLPLPGYAEIKLALAPYKKLGQIIKNYAPDSIHISTEGPLGWAARKYCVRNNWNFTTSYHTQFPDYVAKRLTKFTPFLYSYVHGLAKNMIVRFHKPASAILISTQSLKEQLRGWGIENPIHFLTRGVKLDLFYPGEKTLFQNLRRPVALYVGRVAVEKNLEDFLSMPWQGSKVIVGEGPSKNSLSQQYPEAVFTGQKTGKELAEHFRSADIFVFPSRTDTFGIVLIEALASGLPVAGYTVTGPKDIITQDFLGALEDNDLGKAALRALENKDAQKRAQHVKNTFTWEKAGEQFEKCLHKYKNT